MAHEPNRSTSDVQVRSGSFTIAWILLAVAVVVNIVAFFLNWYDRPWFDEVIHAYTLFALTSLVGLHLYGNALTGYRWHKPLLVFTLLCVGLALGVFWEWGEWAYDHLFGPKSTIQGKTDTLVDLIMDGIGGLIAGLTMLGALHRSDSRRS